MEVVIRSWTTRRWSSRPLNGPLREKYCKYRLGALISSTSPFYESSACANFGIVGPLPSRVTRTRPLWSQLLPLRLDCSEYQTNPCLLPSIDPLHRDGLSSVLKRRG